MILIIICLALVLLLGFAYTLVRNLDHDEDKEPRRRRPPPNRAVDRAAPRRAQLARNRAGRLRANVPQAEDLVEENEDLAEQEIKAELPDAKMGAKKKAKLEAKAEKKAQRIAEEKMRVDKKKREQEAEEERRKQKEKEEAEEKQKEEEERKAREEKEKREHEEYLKMKEAFLVEEEGFEEGERDEQNLLQEFVSYIQKQKVVIIEDLAAQFKLKTQAAIDRIKDLQNDDILTGVIDDRGKFIYISQDEMNAIVKFIKQRGRVSIAEFAENSNSLINLAPVGSN